MGLRRRELALSSVVNRSWIRGPVPGGGFSPLQLPNLNVWLSSVKSPLFQLSTFATPAQADTDPVGGWKDIGPNGRNVIQATAGNRPILKLAIQNGRNAIRGNGTSQELGNTAFGGLNYDQLSVYIAATGTTPAVTGCVIRLRDSATGNIFSLFQVNTTNKLRLSYDTSTGTNTVDTAAAYTSAFVACVTVDAASNYVFRVNGAELSGTFPGTKVVRAVDTFNVLGANGANWFGSDIYEAAIANAAHDRATMLKAEAYFRNWLNV